jgi:hypothetical protein
VENVKNSFMEAARAMAIISRVKQHVKNDVRNVKTTVK